MFDLFLYIYIILFMIVFQLFYMIVFVFYVLFNIFVILYKINEKFLCNFKNEEAIKRFKQQKNRPAKACPSLRA